MRFSALLLRNTVMVPRPGLKQPFNFGRILENIELQSPSEALNSNALTALFR